MLQVAVRPQNMETFREAVARFGARATEDIRSAIVIVQATTVEVARSGAPRFTGGLANSIVSVPPVVRLVSGVGAVESVSGVVQTGVAYALPAEEGRKPGKWPPYQPIRRWVDLMLKRGRFSEGGAKYSAGRRGSKKRAKHDALVERLTFLVRRKIGRKGTDGKKFMEAAARHAAIELPRVVAAMVRRWTLS